MTGTSREDVRDVALATPYFHSQSSRYLTIWPSGPWTSQCILSRFYYPGSQSILVRAWLVTVSGLLDQNKHSRRKEGVAHRLYKNTLWTSGLWTSGHPDFKLLAIQTSALWTSGLWISGHPDFGLLAIQTSGLLDFWPSNFLFSLPLSWLGLFAPTF